jgi:hypothetical protein
MFDYREAAAAVAAALDDPERSLIGDPRQGLYKVSLVSSDMREAMEFAKQLARLGISPTTTITHDELGQPLMAYVNVYAVDAQKALLEIVQAKLSEKRRQALADLVLARSPIPDELLEKIWTSHERGRTPYQIATRMNERDVMPGRGGKGWTAKKVQAALSEFQRRREQEKEAAA